MSRDNESSLSTDRTGGALNVLKRVVVFCSVLAMTVAAFAGTAFAEEFSSEGTNKEKGHLEIEYYADEQPISDAAFQIYPIGTLENNIILYNDVFSKYQLTTERSTTLPNLLRDYIKRDQIAGSEEQLTDIEGKCQFRDLDSGLYLISGREKEQVKEDDNGLKIETAAGLRFRPQSLLVEIIPGKTIIVEPKQVLSNDLKESSISVLKVWKGVEETNRPDKISVDLLKDGQVSETVELNTENTWSYQWNELSEESEWSVIESQVPEGYTLSSEIVNGTTVLTNTKNEVISPTTLPDDTNKNPTNDGKKLPQTGMLQYPVVFLSLGSIIAAIAGIVCLRKAGKKK